MDTERLALTVDIYRPGATVETRTDATEVSGDRILSGFRLDLRRIWS